MTKGNGGQNRLSLALLAAIGLLAFFLRTYRLGEQPFSWDEGWSVGLSSLSLITINRITALDVHPPLYYLILGRWLLLGRSEWFLRFLSVLAGVLAVPLAYVAGRAWARVEGNEREGPTVALFAAVTVAVSPFLIYYAQVARMFALCVLFVLLATYCLLQGVLTGRGALYLGFVFSAVAALHTFYYSALVLVALAVYAIWMRPRRWKAILLSGAMVILLCLPWVTYAVPPMLERVGNRTGFTLTVVDVLQFVADGIFGLVFAYGSGWCAVGVVAALLLCAIVVADDRRAAAGSLLLPLMAISFVLLAVSAGAKAHMFAARYLIPASPFLCLAMGWAMATLWKRRRWLGALGLVSVLLSSFPTMTGYIYAKPYEVSGSFDPSADYRFLQSKTRSDDIIFFNILSLAGQYERLRSKSDPPWSFVQTWDPVIESLEGAVGERVLRAVRQHHRLWFVMYKGTVGANLALKEWLDNNLFPSFGQWDGDTLYLMYLSPKGTMCRRSVDAAFGEGIWLQMTEYTQQVDSAGCVGVNLVWSAESTVSRSYKVFVHLYSGDGSLVAQHDSVPANELRPTQGWLVGEKIGDRHGLWISGEIRGPLRLVVGLYDPETNTRLTLANGADSVELGPVTMSAPTASN